MLSYITVINPPTMKILILIFIFLSAGFAEAATSSDQSLFKRYEDWMAEHERYYPSDEEKATRFEIFKANLQHIESFNAGNHTYKLGLNQFSDLTHEEFLHDYASGMKLNPHVGPLANMSSLEYENLEELPDYIDWRVALAVSGVGNQGRCGCCWAFSAVAAIEGIVALRSKTLVPLSEQHLLDCNDKNEGCGGGWMHEAFNFVMENGGLASDMEYPYRAKQGACRTDKPSAMAAKLTWFGFVPSRNERALMHAVARQPVSVTVDPRLLQHYRSGILSGKCGTSLTHAVTAVGYGVEDGMKYWVFKNSWGSKWGDQGYVKLEREIPDKAGMCGIAIYATFPTA